MKLQVNCSRCGFMAFVEAHAVTAETLGWQSVNVNTTRGLCLRGICPACVGEEAPVAAVPRLVVRTA
jgi:hypothetical protein